MVDGTLQGGRSMTTTVEDERAEPSALRVVGTEVSAMIDALEDTYRFRQRDEVRAFLIDHPDLLELVLETSTKVPEYVPIDQPMALEVVSDPDDEEGGGQLYAVVLTHREPPEIRPRMEQMDREWLIAAFRPAGDLFNIAVEYH